MEPPPSAGPVQLPVPEPQSTGGAEARAGVAAGGADGAVGREAAGSRRVKLVSPDNPREKQPLLPGTPAMSMLAAREAWWMVSHEVIAACIALLWLALGVLFLVFMQGFSFLEALYLTAQLVTTIGYGDVPVHPSMEGFLSVYMLGCIIFVAFVLSRAVDACTRVSTDLLRSRMRAAEQRMGLASNDEDAMAHFGHLNDLISGTLIFAFFLIAGCIFFASVERCTCGTRWDRIPGCQDGALCKGTGGRILTIWSALYMSIVTLTTCGFGDRTPHTTAGIIFSLFWTIGGVGACANFIRACSMFFLQVSHRRSYQLKERINKQLFQEMDVTGDGRLSRGEFLRFLLLKYELVDHQILDEIGRQYDLLDPDGTNSVSFEAIQAMYAEQGVAQTPPADAEAGERSKFYDATTP